MALPTITNWAGSSVVDNLVNTAYSYLLNRMLPADNEAELNRLQTALPQIIAIMDIAEALKVKHPNAGTWVEQFRQALEASEDVLDELEYKRLEGMVENQDEVSGSASSSKKRKLRALNDDTLERLKGAVTMLNRAADDVEHLLQVATVVGIQSPSESLQEAGRLLRYESSSFLAEREVFGRNVEKDKIIDWLKRPTHARLSSFGIVGVGGLGKTTLVQFAYQEMCGSNHFDKQIWVCVSINFGAKDIMIKILGELGETSCCGKPLNALQDILKEKIYSKKILLILDDVWDDMRRMDWEQLIVPLRFAQQGSKILFTTRMKSVVDLLASVISAEHESLALQGLCEQELRLLFNSYAFHDLNPENHRDLLAIGNQIVKMLQGSPLAAKVIGSLLNSRTDHQYWLRTLNYNSIFNLDIANDVMEVLKLSYYDLPPDLQICFRFCSIFPKGHLYDKNDLIKMWIASGFIRKQLKQEERPEDIGEDYFNHLLRKSFFEYSKSWESKKYVMHDLMHELAQNVSNGECCRVEPNESLVTVPSTVRHVSVHESEIDRVSHLENLRSLIIFPIINMNPFVLPNNLIKKPLRLLKIYGYRILELPQEINCLVHLRYLSIGSNYVSQPFMYSLLASIYKLYHLQILEFPRGHYNSSYLGVETSKITNLVRLRYMRLPKEIMKTIHGVQKLTSLQELTFFVGQESDQHINELGTLNNLRYLSIKKIENIEDPAEAKSANLLEKKNLMSLSLKWTSESIPKNPEEIIDYIQPHANLMELTIKNYKGQRSPRWMEESPPLNLSSLKLFSCPAWKNQLFSWQMPYLKILDICDCLNLDKLPNMPLSLIEFHIRNVGLTSLPNLYRSYDNIDTLAQLILKSSLRVVQIERCPNLISLDGFLQQDDLDLEAIVELTINNCESLVHLPTHGFGNLTSLIHFTLRNSPKLVAMDFLGYLLPTRLQRLNMGNCSEFDVPLLEASSNLTTLTEVQISKTANITSITASHNSFRYLKSLNIWGCTMLVEISFQEEAHGINQENNFNILKMDIMDCPDLTKLPRLPLSLTTFLINNVAVSVLPQYYQISSSIGGPSASSLTEVRISKCHNLTSLDGFMQQDNIDFQSIKEIEISNCRNLVRLPVGAFGKFMHLMELTIRDCPFLKAVDNQNNLLPMALKYLSIENCGELDVPLLESASSIDTLTDLSFKNCANISQIPSSENAFRSLSSLSINGCDKLVEYSSKKQAHNINQGSNLTSLKLSHLTIDHLSLILIEPLRSLRFVRQLLVLNCSGMEELPEQWFLQNSSNLRSLTIRDASSLKSLPATMTRLTALEWLKIWKGDLLQELPEFPASLIAKEIKDSGGRFL